MRLVQEIEERVPVATAAIDWHNSHQVKVSFEWRNHTPMPHKIVKPETQNEPIQTFMGHSRTIAVTLG
jgi:hypothetical protein